VNDAVVNTSARGSVGYLATRGREQQLIDFGGGVPNTFNLIRGVARANPLACVYHLESDLLFFPLHQYTGLGDCP